MPLEPVALSLAADTELEADLEELTVDDLFADDIESLSPTSADAAESERLRMRQSSARTRRSSPWSCSSPKRKQMQPGTVRW